MVKNRTARSILVFILGLVIMAGTSCSRKTTNISKTSESTFDSTSVRKETGKTITDKSVIKTTEEFDTTVKTKADTAKASMVIDPESDTPVEVESESGGVKVKVKYDPKSKRVSGEAIKKAEDISVKGKKTTVKENDVMTNESSRSDSTVTQKTDKQTYQKTKVRKGFSFGGWVAIVGGGLVVLFFIGIMFVPGMYGKILLLIRKVIGK